MKMKTRLLLCGLIALLLVVGVPFLINELYKNNSGYMTVWGAADVLSYYGTLLGTCVTVGALIVTIRFTKKQIMRDSYIKFQEEKWNRIESMVSSSLETIHPARAIEILSRETSAGHNATITGFLLYILQAKTALDSLFGYMSGEDYERLKPLLLKIQNSAYEYCDLVTKLCSEYDKLDKIRLRKNAEIVYNKAHQNPAKNMDDLLLSQKFLSETSSLNETEIRAEIKKLGEMLSSLRDTSYRSLLEQKRSKFSEIHAQWTKEAESMLQFWRS